MTGQEFMDLGLFLVFDDPRLDPLDLARDDLEKLLPRFAGTARCHSCSAWRALSAVASVTCLVMASTIG